MSVNKEKLRNLVHYICDKCNDPTKLGATKLNKILLYSDRSAFLNFGKPITNEVYVKLQYGPVPKHIVEVIDDLVAEGKIVVREGNHYGRPKREYFSLQIPDLSKFSANEISLVDFFVEYICLGHTATSISEMSHDKIWEMAKLGEEIPYNTVFASDLGEINKDDLDWANEQLSQQSY